MPPIIGIDLGTTKSVVAVWQNGKPHIIPDSNGFLSIPSLILVTEDEKIFAGRMAQNHPDRYRSKNVTISSVKRLMGKRGETGWGWWKTYPQEVSALILAELKSQAERHLGEKIKGAVIAIPSHFDESQRRATKEAAEIAGLAVYGLLNEATAAVLAYESQRQGNRKTLVFDFGGGTLDISIVDCGEGVYQVKCIEGDSKLGGDDFDQVIVDYVVDKINKEFGSIELDLVQKMVLKEAVEAAKISLSSTYNTSIYIPGFLRIGQSHRNLEISLNRLTFEQQSKGLLDRAMILLQKALKDAGLQVSQLDSLLLLGGSGRIPFVRDRIKKELGVEPAIGVDVETCVAQGATIWSAVRNGRLKELLLLDVIPSTYGIGLKNDLMSPLISKNTTVPTSKSQNFTTTEDSQSTINVTIYQGEQEKASENTLLSSIELGNIPPAPAGMPQIEVTFDIDVDMIVSVSAKDLGTGKKQRIVVKSPYGLNTAQIKLMQGRLKSWISEGLIPKTKSDIISVTSSIETALSTKAATLCLDRLITILEEYKELNILGTKAKTNEDLEKVLNLARSLYSRTQEILEKYEKFLKEFDDLADKIEKFARYSNKSNEKSCVLLNQGRLLLEDYIHRGLPYEELQKMFSGVCIAYEGAMAETIQIEIENLKSSQQMRVWAGMVKIALPNSSLVQQCLSELRTIKEVGFIVGLFESEDWTRRNLVQQNVLVKIRGDSYSEACFTLVVYAFLNSSILSMVKQIPRNENNSLLLAITLFSALDERRPVSERRNAAQDIADYLFDTEYIAPIVSRISSEKDVGTSKILLCYINKLPEGIFGGFIKHADSETKACVSTNKEMLMKLVGEPDESSNIFAVESLINFPSETTIPVLIHFTHHQNPILRIKAIELASKSGSEEYLLGELFVPALWDSVPEIRILALQFIEQTKGLSCIPHVLSLIKSEQNEAVKEKAIATLCSFKDTKVIPNYLKLLFDESISIRSLAILLVERNKELIDSDVNKFIKLIKDVSERKQGINFGDSVFIWRFLKKHPEMDEVVQILKETSKTNG